MALKSKKYYFSFFNEIIFLTLLLLIINCSLLIGEIRYVSKTGSSTPPYTSWETASDSIQKAINISKFGDTIYVANGVYKERVFMIPGLSLIGSGMDSCVIDTRNVQYTVQFTSVEIFDSCYLSNFKIITYSRNQQGSGILMASGFKTRIEFCNIQEAYNGIAIFSPFQSKPIVYKNEILNVNDGLNITMAQAQITENIIINPGRYGFISQINSMPTYLNNIVITENKGGFWDAGGFISVVKNNIFYNVGLAINSYGLDTVINNVAVGPRTGSGNGYWGVRTILNNNHFEGFRNGIIYDNGASAPPPVFQYNNMWNNERDYINFTADSTNISVDPMFVKPDSMDFQLQMYSPLIDAGDPNILDRDGSRSDIGLFGGPYGEKYTYRDLAPRPPRNVTGFYEDKIIRLNWERNTEADFSHYRIYRDTVPNFIYSKDKMVGETSDTTFGDNLPLFNTSKKFYYLITAYDNQNNQSAPSEEISVILTGLNEHPPVVLEEYKLLNNYPNPFNSSTIIPYRLKEAGYVKLYIYDIKGELVRILVNEYQNAGYYEVRFSPTKEERNRFDKDMEWWTGYNDDIATGIYIYKLMVRGGNNVPVFTDIKKMILLK